MIVPSVYHTLLEYAYSIHATTIKFPAETNPHSN